MLFECKGRSLFGLRLSSVGTLGPEIIFPAAARPQTPRSPDAGVLSAAVPPDDFEDIGELLS
jgi:hypothetical protein